MAFISFSGLAAVVAPASRLIVAVSPSSALTNNASEVVFDNTGDSIVANQLKAGDCLEIEAQGIATATTGSDTLTVKLKLGTTLIVSTGAMDMTNSDIFRIKAKIVIRTIGASGTLVATGTASIGTGGASSAIGSLTPKEFFLASTAIDTTAAIALNVSGQWSAASSSDSCRLDIFTVDIVRKADQLTT